MFVYQNKENTKIYISLNSRYPKDFPDYILEMDNNNLKVNDLIIDPIETLDIDNNFDIPLSSIVIPYTVSAASIVPFLCVITINCVCLEYFFMYLANASIKRIAIENPVGIMSSCWRKPDQKIQPYMFGDPFSKGTCLWLKNLQPLHPSKETDDTGEWIVFESGKKQPKWYSDALTKSKSAEERRTLRSKTFPGIARAIAEQWCIQIAWEESLLDEKELAILGKDYMQLDRKNKEDLIEIENREQRVVEYWLNN